MRWCNSRVGKVGFAALVGLAIGCGDDGEEAPDQRPDAAVAGGDAAGAPDAQLPTGDGGAEADAGPAGCASLLAPPLGAALPEALVTGPWHRCGAHGSGAARVIRTSANGERAVVITDAGDAFVLAVPSLAKFGAFAHGTGRVSFAALSPDGTLLATVNDVVGEVALWDVDSASLLRVMTRPPAWPSLYDLGDVAFSQDGALLAVTSVDHLDVYVVATGVPLPISNRDDVSGMRVAFAAGGERLVVARFDYFGNGPFAGWGLVDVMDTATGENAIRLPYDFHIQLPALAVSGDGDVVAISTVDGIDPVAFFDPATGAALAAAAMTGTPLVLSNDGAQVALWDATAGAIRVRDVGDGSVVDSIAVAAPTVGIPPKAVTADLDHALLGGAPPHVLAAVRLDDEATEGVACGTGHSDQVVSLAQTADGQTLVETAVDASADLTARAWDVASGAPLATVPESAQGPGATSPDGSLIAEPGLEPSFDLKDAATGAVIRSVGPHVTRVTGLEFSPDGTRIASASERDPADRSGSPPFVKVWITETGALEQSIETAGSATPLFHPDGDRLFVGGEGTVTVWCR